MEDRNGLGVDEEEGRGEAVGVEDVEEPVDAAEVDQAEAEPQDPVEALQERIEQTFVSIRSSLDRVASRYERAYALTENLLRVGQHIFPEKISDDHIGKMGGFHGEVEGVLDRVRGMIDRAESGAQSGMATLEEIRDPQEKAAAAHALNASLDRVMLWGTDLVSGIKSQLLGMVFNHPRSWSPSDDLAES